MVGWCDGAGYTSSAGGGGGVLLIWSVVKQGPAALAVGAGGGCLDIFVSSVISLFFSLSLRDGPI